MPALLVLALVVLAGCADPHKKFYQPVSGASQFAAAPAGGPELVSGSGDPIRNSLIMYERGFIPVGYSCFVGRAASAEEALEQGAAVGARLVVVSGKFAGRRTGYLPLSTPSTATTYSSGAVNAYGTGGYAYGNYSGTSTTTSYQTSYIPYQVDQYDQTAVFYAPMKRTGLGARVEDPTAATKQAIGSNRGVFVLAVRQGSPAFAADLLTGDIIVAIDGRKVTTEAALRAMLQTNVHGPMMVAVFRGSAKTGLAKIFVRLHQ